MPAPRIPYALPARDQAWQAQRGDELLGRIAARRSCREFSPRPVPRGILEKALAIAHTAPSGANRRPWRFVCINDPEIKREIRIAAEAEEKESYERRMPDEWLEALEPIGTTWQKPFLEIAPWLVVVFQINQEERPDGSLHKCYYPAESAGLACGFFLWACHELGLATLTHTPSPMNFLRDICRRPSTERPFLLIPVGYPARDATVPDLPRKPLSDAVQWNR
ncbi:MAG: nitroreductase family protein [Planctomycetes bacterium]|nr:nitroreductase family protein [Planctomycetota bacterium]